MGDDLCICVTTGWCVTTGLFISSINSIPYFPCFTFILEYISVDDFGVF